MHSGKPQPTPTAPQNKPTPQSPPSVFRLPMAAATHPKAA
ncbi:hypothetical protein GCWU000324_00420 [Kingella oralis ATCC 51147]|uniref:Uncharacterized protein n=1 Tax=Kingella oralis ATCC 51147 TaxID=629741 RepID=C4GHT2_9NEIS|nr:hypothetical protein GCWU000324_00420 [Kingella oralis ATCC 51147]